MGNNWPRVKVSEVCELIVDCVNKTAPVSPVPTPYKMIRTPNIKNGRVSTDDCRYVDADTFAKWTRRATVDCYDVLLTREAPLGEVGIVNSSENLFLGQRVMQYRADKTKLDAHFLLYSFLSPALQHQFSMHEGSGSVVSHIRVGDCSKFELSLPPLDLQKRIAGILRNLDNKITLNRQVNQTLEQMAQTLFKSWFVDFDPVVDNALDAGFFEQDLAFPDELLRRAEARKAVRESGTYFEKSKPLPEAIRQLFPAAFEECTEPSLGLGGWVPQGWSYYDAEKIANVSIGKTPPRKESEWFSDTSRDNITWVSIKDMGTYGAYTCDSSEYLTPDAVAKFNVKLVPKGSILLSFKLTLGRVAIASDELTTNEAIAHFVSPKFGINTPYLYGYLSNFNYNSLGSTSSIATAVNSKIIKKMPILVPAAMVLNSYEKQVASSFEKMKSLDIESSALTNLRDTLLPKLISGELRLSEIAADIAAESVE